MNQWLGVEASKDDRYGLYEVVRSLSEALASNDLQIVLVILQSVGCSTIIVESLKSQLESGEIRSHVEFAIKLEMEIIRVMPEKKRRAELLCNWLQSRSKRPEDQLPPWVSLIGSSDIASASLPLMVGWIFVMRFDELTEPAFSAVEMAAQLQVEAPGETMLSTSEMGDLVVAALPSTELFRRPDMPEHSLCHVRSTEDATLEALEDEPSVRLFVSHAWRSKPHPDPHCADWLSLRDHVFGHIADSVWLYKSLQALGFSSKAIVDKAFLLPGIMTKSLLKEVKQFGSYKHFVVDSVGDHALQCVVADALAARMLKVVAFCLNQEPSIAANEEILYLAIARRVLLWIDFVCLPQSVTCKRSDEDEIWFQSSLQQLGAIQRSMHTVVVNTNEEYCDRAWCTAEYINTNESFSLVSATGFKPQDRMKASIDACLRAMVSTEATSALEVIGGLGLGITNGADADAVCRILWSRIGLHLQKGAPAIVGQSAVSWLDNSSIRSTTASQPWTVAEGRASLVSSYLQALGTPSIIDYDKGWRKWRDDFSAQRSAEKSSEKLQIQFLADSRVRMLGHDLNPCLSSISWFISISIEPDTSVRVRIVSRHLKEDDHCVFVAFPTSNHVEFADAIVLHPQRNTFRHVDAKGMPTRQSLGKTGARATAQKPGRPPKAYDVIPKGTTVTLRSQRLVTEGTISGYHSGLYTITYEDATTRRVKPSDLLQIALVQLHGIQSKPGWNGKKAFIMGWNASRERYLVHVLDGINDSFNCSPSKLVLQNGTVAQIKGLVSKPELNDKYGTIVHWDRSTNRYHVQLSTEQTVSVGADKVLV